ncbi:hypothetical protein [Kitasatospora sp. NPDC097643]|uniref:hypothetical protein n=1 Tax=Kitasatospora sp. NPDC097643 TaxID=3157230 RepID=UPI003316969B
MTQLEDRAVRALAEALGEIHLLASVDRRTDLVDSIRRAPGVGLFVAVPDNVAHTHLTRIARACVDHDNAPAARQALHDEVQRLAGGQRAVSWLGFCNKVLDADLPVELRIRLLEFGITRRRAGWGNDRPPGRVDPLSEFTRLVVGGSAGQIDAFCAAIDGPNWGGRDTLVVPTPPAPGKPPGPGEPPKPPKRPRWPLWVAAVGLALLITWVVDQAIPEDKPPVSVPVGWSTTTLQPDGTAVATVAVPDGRPRLVLPLDLSDKNPAGGACPGTRVEVALDEQKGTLRGLSEEVRIDVPAHQPTLMLRLTLRAGQNCAFRLNTTAVRFEG